MTERKLRRRLLNAIPVETERLVLRRVMPEDAYDMYDYASRPEVCEYLLWSPHLNLAATEGYIGFLQERYNKGLYGDWAIELKKNGRMIGTCGYADINTHSLACEIGYVLSPDYRKHGYMTEAVGAVLGISFDILGFEKATLRIIKENTDSLAIAAHFGFKPVMETSIEIKGRVRDVLVLELDKEGYKK